MCGASRYDLVRQIREADWKVNPAHKERTTEDWERWILARYLTSSDCGLDLPAPIVLLHGDKPDFIICAGNKWIGIEVSRVVSEVVAIARSQAQLIDLDVYSVPNTADYPTKASRMSIGENIQNPCAGTPWLGDEVEEEFIKLVIKRVQEKTSKSADYFQTDTRILLLLDDSGLPIDERAFQRAGGQQRLTSVAECARSCFDKIALMTVQQSPATEWTVKEF